METNEKINYMTECEKLESFEGFERLDWFLANAGQYKVKIVSEGKPYKKTIKDEKGKDKELDKIRYEIEINGKKQNFGVTKAKTQNSLWGQLCLIGSQKGILEGVEFTLLVKGQGMQKDYTIIEALPLMKPRSEKVKLS